MLCTNLLSSGVFLVIVIVTAPLGLFGCGKVEEIIKEDVPSC